MNQLSNARKRGLVMSASAGIGAALVLGFSMFAIGQVGPFEARQLIEAIAPTSRFLCSAVMTAAATILALMLTLLSLGKQTDGDLGREQFLRIRHLAKLSMFAMVAATVFLVLHCVPIFDEADLPSWWYPAFYYSLLAGVAALGGTVIGLVVLLYLAIRDFIDRLAPEAD